MTDYIRHQHQVSLLLYIHNAGERANLEKLQEQWPDVTFYVFDAFEEERINAKIQSSPYASMPWLRRKVCEYLEYWHLSTKRKLNRHKWRHAISLLCQSTTTQSDRALSAFVRANSNLYRDMNDFTPAFCEYVSEVSRMDFDAIQVEFYEYLHLVYLLPTDTQRIFVHHELRFVRNDNELHLFQHPFATERIMMEREKAMELAALNCYDTIVTLTETDRSLLSRYIPPKKIVTSPAITENVHQAKLHFRQARELVFIGSGSHFPNADGMMWFCHQVAPVLRQHLGQIPDIHITGQWRRAMRKCITRLCPEAVFDGFVNDLPSFINGKIAIVPIRIGSGMRMKILDAFSAAAPLVTTSKGCEGLLVTHGKECFIADTPEAFATAITDLLDNPMQQQRLAESAQHSDTSMLNETDLIRQRLAIYDLHD
ncbi:MAG: glycosyltransferase [Bacteroidaceae bacterium]|nr:glycosyltransferase [Bacteroidaceae bacterium]